MTVVSFITICKLFLFSINFPDNCAWTCVNTQLWFKLVQLFCSLIEPTLRDRSVAELILFLCLFVFSDSSLLSFFFFLGLVMGSIWLTLWCHPLYRTPSTLPSTHPTHSPTPALLQGWEQPYRTVSHQFCACGLSHTFRGTHSCCAASGLTFTLFYWRLNYGQHRDELSLTFMVLVCFVFFSYLVVFPLAFSSVSLVYVF